MSKSKLAGCDAVGKQIAQSSRKENSNPFIYIHFFAQNIDSIRNKRTGNSHGKGVCAYAQAVVSGIEDKHEEIDEIIASHLKKGWTLSRISKPSLAILRLAIYEMKYLDNVPQSVSINEAVELAKKYTIDESKFVNGILGTYSREFSGKSEK